MPPRPGRVHDPAGGLDGAACDSQPAPQLRLAGALPRLRERGAGRVRGSRLDLGQHPGRERFGRLSTRSRSSRATLGDDRVLVLAEHVLHVGDRPRELCARVAEHGVVASAAYRHRFARIRTACSASSGGVVAEVVDRLAAASSTGWTHDRAKRVERAQVRPGVQPRAFGRGLEQRAAAAA